MERKGANICLKLTVKNCRCSGSQCPLSVLALCQAAGVSISRDAPIYQEVRNPPPPFTSGCAQESLLQLPCEAACGLAPCQGELCSSALLRWGPSWGVGLQVVGPGEKQRSPQWARVARHGCCQRPSARGGTRLAWPSSERHPPPFA